MKSPTGRLREKLSMSMYSVLTSPHDHKRKIDAAMKPQMDITKLDFAELELCILASMKETDEGRESPEINAAYDAVRKARSELGK